MAELQKKQDEWTQNLSSARIALSAETGRKGSNPKAHSIAQKQLATSSGT